MKIEVEITQEEIDEAVIEKMRSTAIKTIADRISKYETTRMIAEMVDQSFKFAVRNLIDEEVNNTDALKAKVSAELEKKLRSQLSSALRMQAKDE